MTEKNFAYQEALKNKDDAVYAAQKTIDSAGLSVPNDNSGIIQMKMEKEKIETQLQELQDIKDQKGEVKAPVAGVVTAIDKWVPGQPEQEIFGLQMHQQEPGLWQTFHLNMNPIFREGSR